MTCRAVRPSSHLGDHWPSCAASPRSVSIVASPASFRRATTQPVRPDRGPQISTPWFWSSADRRSPVGSAPITPIKRDLPQRRAASAATFAALPPRRVWIRAGVSVPERAEAVKRGSGTESRGDAFSASVPGRAEAVKRTDTSKTASPTQPIILRFFRLSDF